LSGDACDEALEDDRQGEADQMGSAELFSDFWERVVDVRELSPEVLGRIEPQSRASGELAISIDGAPCPQREELHGEVLDAREHATDIRAIVTRADPDVLEAEV